MLTREDVLFEFRAVAPNALSEGQKMRMLKINKNYEDLALDLIDLVPICAHRTAAIRELLLSKWTAIQAITHEKKESASANKSSQKDQEGSKEQASEKSQEADKDNGPKEAHDKKSNR